MGGEAIKLRNPIMVALDVDDAADALALAQRIGPGVGCLKIGPRLSVRYGQSLVGGLAKYCPVFVDNKFLDIPSTMLAAVKATFEAGATFTTVHSWAGPEALQKLAELEKDLNKTRPFKILVVTVLTSFTEKNLPYGLKELPIAGHVDGLTQQSIQSGLSGIVCSPLEVQGIKKKFPGIFAVTPGIRWGAEQASQKADQARTLTPTEAVKAGANALVIGRPIVEAANPAVVIEQILEDLVSTR